MSHPVFKKKLLASCVAAACSASMSMAAQAQGGVDEEVVVFGIRGSLERSADIKREAFGVVDAISAEDMGKFPDTNLAESLQRITGVSIDRVNGEGSNVTVRGFGGGNNLVTLNGRHMPAANVATVGGDQNSDFAQGSGRSFDFSNLASEGVSGLEVYKTGRASIPTGGIGATINIKTQRPLDNPGFQGSIGAKLVNDTGVVDGDDFTPEFSGLVSWTDDSETFGVSLFASYQERNGSSRSATVNGWNIRTFDFFNTSSNGLIRNDGSTDITNAPVNGSTLVSFPNDSRWHLAESERERTNAMLTLQFRPQENLTLTLDALMAENSQVETRNDSTNWFNRPFDEVVFNSGIVPSTVFLYEEIAGVKDMGFEQQLRSVEDTLDSVGLNLDWQLNDSLKLNFDIYSATSESSPTGPHGTSSILVGLGAPVVAAHSVDFRNGFPVQTITLNDAARGNNNGVLDVGDLGSSIGRTISSSQETELDGVRVDLTWEQELGTFDFGVESRTAEMSQFRTQTQQTWGNWGLDNPGEVPEDMIEAYCLACLFDDFSPNASGAALVSFKGDATRLFNHFTGLYSANPINLTQYEDNVVEEDITSFYVQFSQEGELGGVPYQLLAGLRYEQTDVTSTSYSVPVEAIIWQADNDFTVRNAAIDEGVYLTQKGDYSNTLPSIDLALNVTDDIKLRGSISKTIARPGYGSLFVADTAGTPNRPGALGGVPTGGSGNPRLKPLESTNIDLSFEWYYADASYFSLGTYNKDIKNFLGTGTETRNVFGLRDPSSGASGTRSGDARAFLIANDIDVTDVNLFTLTAMIDNPGDFGGDPFGEFLTEFGNSGTYQAFVDSVLSAYDIEADSDDPLFDFAVQVPVNTEEANIHGFEVAWQHFFGDTGFGVLANYTTVNGDVSIDVAASPSVNQFALLGLSDTYNLSLIYENHGLSARLSYNWRDKFLNETNRGGDRNPVFVDEYEQLDLNVSYDVTDNLMLSFEAINLAGESTRHYGRDYSNVFFMQELDPRYLLGARYTFE
jgi:TonB-dependent receptor